MPLSDVLAAGAAAARRRVAEQICSTDDYERALHCLRPLLQRRGARLPRAVRPPARTWSPHPRDEDEVEAALEWALSAGAAVIPFGGGTSVVGGVEAARRESSRAW